MGSDSVINVSVPLVSKDSGKKKRPTNRLAKLKQCKLDARREQWLSQAKNKGVKDEINGSGGSSPSSLPRTDGGNLLLGNFVTRSRGGEENEGSSFHDSDLDSLANSPTSACMLGGNDLIRKNRPGSSRGSSSSSGSSSSGCCFGNISSEDDDDDDGLDDWEAVADAFTAAEKGHQTVSECPVEPQSPIVCGNIIALPNRAYEGGILKHENKGTTPKSASSTRAWRADDVFRPQSLPNILKQCSFSISSEHNGNHGAGGWTCHSMISQPSCPICYEDLDMTDSCFLPCSCGFRLCLFCHKRILEADGRCPGCRKKYDPVHCEKGFCGGASVVRLARCCSMIARS